MKKNRHIIVSVLAVILFMGVKDSVVALIDKFIMPVLGIEANTWLGVFFLVVNIVLAISLWKGWLDNRKVVTEKEWSWLFFGEFVYWYFHFSQYYSYDTYWNSLIAYLDPAALLVVITAVCSLFYRKRQGVAVNDKENMKVVFHRDDAILSLDEDIFRLEGFVNRIINYVENTNVSRNAYSIGLVGQWGEGKTSLMNLIKSKLPSNKFLIIDFNPRLSKNAEHIQSDFLVKLRKAMKPYVTGLGVSFDRYAESINAVDTPDFMAWLIKIFAAHKSNESKKYRDRIEDAIDWIEKKIVVFVDDLDRLTGEELVEVMKLIANNGAFKNTLFITAFDKEYVNRMLVGYFGGGGDVNYTDKYFNTEIHVPLHTPHNLRNLLEQMLLDELEKGNLHVTKDQISFSIAANANIVSERLKTVRDVKRFVNQFVFALMPVEEEVWFRDFFLLELLRFAHPEDYTNLHRKKYIYQISIADTSASNDLWYLNDEYNKPDSAADSMPDSIDLLRNLFPAKVNYQSWYHVRGKRIYSVSSFEYYFYRYEYAHLTSKDAASLLNSDLPESFYELERLSNLYPKDVETALVTKDIADYDDKLAVKRYFHLIVGALSIKNTTLNYIPSAFTYLRREDAGKLMNVIGAKNRNEYAEWMTKTLMELLSVSPKSVSHYLHHAVAAYHENVPVEELYYFTEKETVDISVKLFKAYLDTIEDESWDVEQAFSMSMFLDSETHLYKEIAEELRKSIMAHFSRYSGRLLVIGGIDKMKASFYVFFRFDEVFSDQATKDEFEKLLFSAENDNATGVNGLRAFWPIFKANSYKEFLLTGARGADNSTEYDFKSETEDLAQYRQYDKEIDALVDEWKGKQRLSECDRMIGEFGQLRGKIKAIPLQISLKELYDIQIADVIATINDYKTHAADITDDILQLGDFVRFRDGSYLGLDVNVNDMVNIFTFQGMREQGFCKLKEFQDKIPITQLQAVPIDGKSDLAIYYDPPVAASIVNPGQHVSVHHTDYSYYMDSFAKHKEGDKTYMQMVEEQGFQFVHEVQHWLKENEGASHLRIKPRTYEDIIER